MMERFKKLVDDLTEEFDDYSRRYGSGLTCEFSTSSEDFEDKVDYLNKKMVHNGYWHIMRCDTCKGYYEDRHWHVQIVDAYDWEARHKMMKEVQQENRDLKANAEAIKKDIQGKEYYPKGSLMNFLNIFEALVEDPEQYPEYLDATLVADLTRSVHGRYLPEHVYDKCKERLDELLELDEDKVDEESQYLSYPVSCKRCEYITIVSNRIPHVV